MRPSILFLTLGLLGATALGCDSGADDEQLDQPLTALGLADPSCGPVDAGTDPSDGGARDASTPETCDRACLLAFMQGYLDALVARDPSRLDVAPRVKVTENGVVTELGQGLWRTASTLVPAARLDFADPVEGQVATQTVVNENGATPVIYSARLKVVNRQITEVETIAVRRQGAANGFFNPAKMVPEPAFLQPIEPGRRMSRAALNALTEQYLDYLEGKRTGEQVPFEATCKRYENGQVTASGLSSFRLQRWRFQVTRRTLIIDEEAGITWGVYPFSQAANALVVAEAFKLVDGKITMIQAVMANMPAKAWN